jgi:iron(III) transport system substrate-binding protein
VLASQLAHEFDSNDHVADVYVNASRGTVIALQRKGWTVPAVGPDLYAKFYDRAVLAKPGNAFIVGTFIPGIAWNTNLVKSTVASVKDFTKPAWKGKFGVPQPTTASQVDLYLWLEENFGKNIVRQLAANKPRIYLSSLTVQQAIVSGEIQGSFYVPGTALDQKKQGAPITWKLTLGAKSWNAPFYGNVVKGAPHPNAAQLLADYMVTKAGMGAAQHLTGAVIKGIAETFYAVPRTQKLLTAKQVADYQASWSKLFK